MSDDSDDSPPPRPRRKIKKIVLASSSSGSESEDSGPATSTRKKRLRVLSDEESSGSSVGVGRRKRALQLRDSEGDSDTSGWATDHSDAARAAPAGSDTQPKPTSGFASDSSEGNSDKCPICLMRFTDQLVGTPQTCEHVFCLDCISEWSKSMNTCPVDRKTFDFIVVRPCTGGKILSIEPVVSRVLERSPSVEMLFVEDPTACEICGSTSSEETMLLCDGCDLGFHMECLTPPLTQVPRHQWLCASCSDRYTGLEVGAGSDVELFSDASDAEGSERGAEAVPRSAWQNVVERVRRAIRRTASGSRRASRAPRADVPSTSRAVAPRSRAAAPRRRRTRKRRTRTVIIEYELEEDGKRPVTKRVKKKFKRRKTYRRAPRTAARRTQVRAGVRAKLAAQRSGDNANFCVSSGPRALAGVVPAFNLFGSVRDLDYFSGDEEMDTGGEGAVAVAARAMPTSVAIAAYRQARRKMVSIPSPPHAAAAPDILSSILESQTLLHSRRAVVSVAPTTGELDIKLKPASQRSGDPRPVGADKPDTAKQERVDVCAAGGAARQAPSYGGGRGGGWGGGYRYPAERPPPHAQGSYDNGYGASSHAWGGRAGQRPGEPYHGYNDNPPQRFEAPLYERERRPRPFEQERRPPGAAGPAPAPAWPRPYRPPAPQRHSFGGVVDNPLDMRTARPRDKPPREDDEHEQDTSLVIDTDKYDPTEPTDDDELPPASAPAPPPPLAPPPSLAAVESMLAGMETVTPSVLDNAVRHVLREHSLMESQHDSDEASDGDCPNFSIYSATSVHIASGALDDPPPPAPPPLPAPPAPPRALLEPVDPVKRKSDEYNEKVSKRCPITTNPRNPIKIKLNTPVLIRRQVSLYDEEDDAPAEDEAPADDTTADSLQETTQVTPPVTEDKQSDNEKEENDEEVEKVAPEPEETAQDDATPELNDEKEDDPDNSGTPSLPDEPVDEEAASPQPASPKHTEDEKEGSKTPSERASSPTRVSSQNGEHSPEYETCSPKDGTNSPAREKMTESISETEDERSYTPCLDEQREPERGMQGLGTELISEDEGNGLFSEEERRSPPARPASVPPSPAQSPAPTPEEEAPKKKKKKESKGKERKTKSKVVFKKAGKGKERKYRSRSRSGTESPRSERRREKRKDLERYDVRTLVSEKRRRTKDAFGRDVSPRAEPSPEKRRSASPPRESPSPRHRSPSPRRVRTSPSPRRVRTSPSPRRVRTSPSPRRPRGSPSPRRRASVSPRRRISPSPRRTRASPSPSPPMRRSASPRPARRRRRSPSRVRRTEARRRRSGSRARKRRRSGSATKAKPKKKKRARSERPRSRERKSPKRKRLRRRSGSGAEAGEEAWSPRPVSPRTPPPQPALVPIEARRLRKRRDRSKHRRPDVVGPSKEVFTSGDNILVSVSFKEQERGEGAARRARKRSRRRRRRAAAATDEAPAKPVAIIDLARSPCRELTPSPERVIVLSDEEQPAVAPPAAPAPPDPTPAPAAEARGPNTPPEPPDSPDAYDPYEPTASPPPAPAPQPSPPRPSMTLEAAQKTNMSADEVLDRRPLSPIEKVMALLQSTRDAPPDPPPEGAHAGRGEAEAPPPAPAVPHAAPRPQLLEPARAPPPKLFLAKPSPIKSDPIKPMQQATKISRLPLPAVARGGDSPYSPGSSDFGDLFEPPAPPHHAPDHFDALFDKPPPTSRRKRNKHNNKNKKKGKTQVDVKIDDDSLKVLDELPSSAVEMQVKSKVSRLPPFLKKLNRQERVVEEVKLVLKPHYNKKHVTKEEYKHILRRAVPKICHNKTGEINPTKIQALVEAYVNKFRKKRKLGIS